MATEEAIVSHVKFFLDFGPDSCARVWRGIHMVMEGQPGYFWSVHDNQAGLEPAILFP